MTFQGGRGKWLTELKRDLPEEQGCGREVAAETGSFTGTRPRDTFTVGV